MKTWPVANKFRNKARKVSTTWRWLLFAATLLALASFVLPSRFNNVSSTDAVATDPASDETLTSNPTQTVPAPAALKASPTCQKVTRASLAQNFSESDQRDPKHWKNHTTVGSNKPYISCGSACIEHADGTVDVSKAQICIN